MSNRPWRLERSILSDGGAVDSWIIIGTFGTHDTATVRKEWLERVFPNLYPAGRLRIREHVEFEART